MGSTEFARTVVLLAVDADERSRINAGRSWYWSVEERAEMVALSGLARDACDACVLVLGEGLDEVGVECGIGDE